MTTHTVFAGDEKQRLYTLVMDGIRDFETQIAEDPRMPDHLEMPLEDYRAIHESVAQKLRTIPTIDCYAFDRDETQFIAHLAGVGRDLDRPTPVFADLAEASAAEADALVAKAEAMDDERRSTDRAQFVPEATSPSSAGTYSRALLEAAGKRLHSSDWDAHRKLAQIAVDSGYAAEVTQEFTNGASDQHPLRHSIRVIDATDIVHYDEGIDVAEGPMGDTTTIEQFTHDRPHGYFGQTTPFDDAPINDDDPAFPIPSDDHLRALSTPPPTPPPHHTAPDIT